ncbi:hypothetical protein [Chitinophaga sp. Cy-1792]|uniref:hypothetical protein n=1 Tax=Chitinophaga sp. Cy-1792 TaxID=2608339 RepID=UPI0014234ADD|nr:hypothetical protein [Chitinophaga sp. Cy-1792]NIG52857.1 hypothetical protein [Chitinophaga sp. Cy-1792]
MRTILVVTLLFTAIYSGNAQDRDTVVLQAAHYFSEADSAARGQKVWNLPLYGPMIFVEPNSRVAYTNVPDSAGIFIKKQEGVYVGKLPADIILANTATLWQNRLWTLVLWPLPSDKDERLSLMMHESFHRIQRQLNLPDNSPTVDHLATMYGRVYFLLELQALKAALNKPVEQRKNDLSNALLFHRKRQQLFPATFPRERILEMNEGLAEYTGMILGRPAASIHQHLNDEIDKTASKKSIIRSMAYVTGPVYGYLLYEKFPAWTRNIDSTSSLSALVEKYYHLKTPEPITDVALNKMAKQYNGAAILQTEKEKEDKRLVKVARYTHRFAELPVLVINLENMSIGFNPNNLFDLGQLGTVYPTAEVNDVWGKLIVTDGGMLMKDWKVVTLSAPEYISVENNTAKGSGWELQLNNGWEIKKDDDLHVVLVRKP